MKARAISSKTAVRKRILQLEPLESRLVLDGGIRAAVGGGLLRIQGDAGDNQIVVEQVAPRSFVISALDGATLINGKSGPATFTGVRKDINITLGAGHDAVVLKGNGALGGRLVINGGGGADDVRIKGLTAQSLSVNMGAGSDKVTLIDVQVAKRSTVVGAAGVDIVSREGNSGEIRLQGFEEVLDSVADLLGASGEPVQATDISIAAIAVGDTAVVEEDAISNTAVGNVLLNDTGLTGAEFIAAVGGFAADVGRPVPGQYGFFQINPDGTFSYVLRNDHVAVNSLNDGQTLTDSITYTVSDGLTTSTGTLAITIEGNTDTGALVGVADAATVIEDAIPNTAVGNVLANDTGGVATRVVTEVGGFAANVGRPVPGQFGYFQLHPDGTFSYILNNDNPTVNALDDGQTLIDSIAYTLSDGSTTAVGTLAITIQGNTDTGPLTAVADAAVVVENAIPNTALGNVLTNDTGGIATKVVSAVAGFAANVDVPVPGLYGHFQINHNGTFSYILNNDNPTVNALNDGQTLSDTIAYTVSDGLSTANGTLTITIQGRTDTGPLTAVNDAAVVTEDATPNTSLGNVLTNDTGGIATRRVTAVRGFAANLGRPVAGAYGVFQIHPDGTFTYILKNSKAQVNALDDGETLTDSIAYTVSDGFTTSTGTLSVTIQGRTD